MNTQLFSILILTMTWTPVFAQSHSMAVQGGTITVEPFTAYYGDHDLVARGGDSKGMPLPNHVGCPPSNFAPAVQKLCPGGKVYYNKIGDSDGNGCGYTIVAGVCVKQSP